MSSGVLLAAGGIAPGVFQGTGGITNSLMVAIVVTVIILLFARMATRKMSLIPGQKQNLVEFVIEFLYSQVVNIVGAKMAPKAFPLLATLFLFILLSNWFGMFPGVGTIGFGPKSGPLTIDTEAMAVHAEELKLLAEAENVIEVDLAAGSDAAASADSVAVVDGGHSENESGEQHESGHFVPLLRAATADLNTTLGMALVFMMVWTFMTIKEVGVMGFLAHTFGPKGGLTGILRNLLIPVFLFVGVIEVISIMFRPVSLSFRLLGNVYAGESLLHAMNQIGYTLGLGGIAAFIVGVVAPIPFYFLEILVGLIQAIVFTLLCAVYIQMSTATDEEH